MRNEILDAIEYVKEQLERFELAELYSQLDEAYDKHLMPENVCTYGRIVDLLNEYGYEHDLVNNCDCEYDWWEDGGKITINDILFEF